MEHSEEAVLEAAVQLTNRRLCELERLQ